jgi:hypothetical protein
LALSAHAPPLHLGPSHPADPAALEHALAGVDRTPAPPEVSYFGEIGRALQEALREAILRGARMVHLSRRTFFAVAVVMAGAALLLIARALWLRLRRRRVLPAPGALAAEPAPAAGLDAAGWRAELERRLAGGRTAEALEAAWWWLARSLAGDRVEPDWTSRDLMARARRPDLIPLVRRLDGLTYGPRRPALDDVRSLVGRLEEALP